MQWGPSGGMPFKPAFYKQMGRQVYEKENVLSPDKNRAWFMGSECTFMAQKTSNSVFL